MTTRFPCVVLEGGLIAADLMDQIADGTAPGQRPADFGLAGGRHLTDEIAAAWADARALWAAFRHRLERLAEDDPATSVTRDQWMIPFFSLLGYELTYTPRAVEADGQTYALSHRAGADESAPPVHVVGCRQSLDRRPESGRPRLAPHSLVQEYLNRSEHLWGIATNGHTLRLLRDSHLLARQAFVEFDLLQMMEAEKFADYALLFRLVHRTRLPRAVDDAEECLLERYRRHTLDQGGRVRDHLRDGVEAAMRALASALLDHPRNQGLREVVYSAEMKPLAFYQQLLHLIYRLLFMMVAEERGLVTDSAIYRDYYGVGRLRALAERRSAYSDYEDLWLGLQTTFTLFYDERIGSTLRVPPLNGDLFDPSLTSALNGLFIRNRDLLAALWHLSMYREGERAPWRRINYAALDVEELGSVYESLLDYQPVFAARDGRPAFDLAFGTERKSTGSYYTPPELVNELIKSALRPVLEERLRAASTAGQKERAILGLKVCDPACGSGHFLLAAARVLGRELARVRTGDDEPAPEQRRLATRDVITHCIYGVDKNPLAVDLCKVALWMEGHARGKPLTFLDHRIRCGDSLVGIFDLAVLKDGIPDAAFKPVAGDDPAVARAIHRQNAAERAGQRRMMFADDAEVSRLSDSLHALFELPDDTPQQVRRKADAYRRSHDAGTKWGQDRLACDLWTGAFFVELTAASVREQRVPTTASLQRALESPSALDARTRGYAWLLSERERFFHWPLEFPDVFAQGGFDVVLGNPPWEVVQPDEAKFFAMRAPEIARLRGAERKRPIESLQRAKPELYEDWRSHQREIAVQAKFMRTSGRNAHISGKLNLYGVFAQLSSQLLRDQGRAGIIVPTGIGTDEACKGFFGELVDGRELVSLFDFENRERLFPAVDSRMKFCLLTLRGSADRSAQPTEFVFFATRAEQIRDEIRHFTLSPEGFKLINPNTGACPMFRTKEDANLAEKVYRSVPILVNEATGDNPWQVDFARVFNMGEVETLDLCTGRERPGSVPMYEAKMISQFDHRFASYSSNDAANSTRLPGTAPSQHGDPDFVIKPRYWVPEEETQKRLRGWKRRWLIGFRDIARATDERTIIFAILPLVGTDFTIRVAFPKATAQALCGLVANSNTLVLDYMCRQSIAGTHLADYVTKQLPFLAPGTYDSDCLAFVVPRVLELVSTAWNLKPFADDLWKESDSAIRERLTDQWRENREATGVHGNAEPPPWVKQDPDGFPRPPFKWDAQRRAVLRAELDACYARLYGLTYDELRYILDPQDVYGPEFPGETFRVLKEKELRQYGEYRTRRLVLEAWERGDDR